MVGITTENWKDEDPLTKRMNEALDKMLEPVESVTGSVPDFTIRIRDLLEAQRREIREEIEAVLKPYVFAERIWQEILSLPSLSDKEKDI